MGIRNRYVVMGQTLYIMSDIDRQRALEDIRDMQATAVEIDPRNYNMGVVSTDGVENWSNMTSAMAESLLAGMPPQSAEEAASLQEAIERDAPLVDVSAENATMTGEGDPTDAEALGIEQPGGDAANESPTGTLSGKGKSL